MKKLKLSPRDSILVKHVSFKKSVLFSQSSDIAREAASLTKIAIALALIKKIPNDKFERDILIQERDLAGYGTDVLSDIYRLNEVLKLSPSVLIGLMLKYSCNSSALILTRKFFPKRLEIQEMLKRSVGLKDILLETDEGGFENKISLKDVYKIYEYLFSNDSERISLIRNKMRESRNIYYLFDQLGANILASKTGTLRLVNGSYIVGDSGIIEVKGNKYFVGAIVERKSISEAVDILRLIGKESIKLIK